MSTEKRADIDNLHHYLRSVKFSQLPAAGHNANPERADALRDGCRIASVRSTTAMAHATIGINFSGSPVSNSRSA
jgi:hypothetical protein